MIEKAIKNLPNYLQERTRSLADQQNPAGELVLYWMRTAVRADENPALDVATELANQLDLPLLVYHGLSQRYKYASDRHHTFMLQGAADVQQQLADLQISYAFHLATPKDNSKHLVDLANRAAIVVTEDMPVDPPRKFLNSLASQIETPIVCVDTACVVPMQLTQKAITRAFQFRDRTETLYDERLHQSWPECSEQAKRYDLKQLPFEPIDFESESISELVARCEIDHSVGPVVDTQGGTGAGYRRWNSFKKSSLRGYASKRNNALIGGVSRMSPYLHYGMVSPMRIAREAASVTGKGGEKYLDELLIWRELAYHFCFDRDDHDQWSALPQWAQDTLQKHALDLRPVVYSWEQLARAQTDDELWNAAQRSLLMHGELHNNVRMTWGKAILNWTADPETALKTMIDLNHRYALDGRDPASYGGLLWCLGQFDRPFKPEQPVFGTVRTRPTHVHADRLDPVEYASKVATVRFSPNPRVAVVGAGMSGVIAARTLKDHGVDVGVFEKSRKVGGRMATRRREDQPVFDHGAQYFTARDERFARYVESWLQQGIVARWPDAGQSIVVMKDGVLEPKSGSVDRYVGTPGMRSVVEYLSQEIPIKFQTTIAKIDRGPSGRWQLYDTNNNVHGPFDQLILSAPAPQTAKLLEAIPQESALKPLIAQIKAVKMNPSWATMVQLESTLDQPIPWAGAFAHDSLLSWIARDSSKPERNSKSADRIVLHATAQWSIDNLERDAETIASEMLDEFWRISGSPAQPTAHLQAHRWRYAIPVEPTEARTLFSHDMTIGCCGDWLGGPRVEGAFLSGMAAAGRILGRLRNRESPETVLEKQKQLFA
jgi:photolyase PhrII